jgi:nitrate reductase assembly molybdenum cofactor insertion protein NarJ
MTARSKGMPESCADREAAVAGWLARSARWRLASLLFSAPSEAVVGEARAVASELVAMTGSEPDDGSAPPGADERGAGLQAGLGRVAQSLLSTALDAWVDEFHRVLGPGGIGATESAYDPNALAGRGPLVADVAGFYRAFAYEPVLETGEVPDHLSLELGYLAFMAMKVAFACHDGDDERRGIAEKAYSKFLAEHLLVWYPRFAEQVEATESTFYGAAAEWLAAIVGEGAD